MRDAVKRGAVRCSHLKLQTLDPETLHFLVPLLLEKPHHLAPRLAVGKGKLKLLFETPQHLAQYLQMKNKQAERVSFGQGRLFCVREVFLYFITLAWIRFGMTLTLDWVPASAYVRTTVSPCR